MHDAENGPVRCVRHLSIAMHCTDARPPQAGLLDTRTRFRGTHKYVLKYVRKLNQCGARAPAAHALRQIKIPLMFGGMRTYHRRNDQLHPRSFW